jgi:uncharacterized membrane protein YqiK
MGPLGWIVLALLVLAAIIVVLAVFYQRATNEVSLVRTGVGGRRVVIDGGTLALPYFHEIARVNMQTIRMDVTRSGEQALITKDKLRVDVGAEFYASVVPEPDAIARAATTLGRRTFQPDQLKSLIDGMMIDALRSVAARSTMDELHENRASFVTDVRDALAGTLLRYGLQLDSVSLTDLDQTPFSALDENNAFNAEGMRKLAEVIATSRKQRAEIEAESEVSLRRSAMEASKKRLELDLEERRAEIDQTREIESLMAAQLADVARKKAEGELAAAKARIDMEEKIQAADLAREEAIRRAEILQAAALEQAEQDRLIQVAAKSQEESRAQAAADAARAEAVSAAEAVQTARQMAEGERAKRVALLKAEEEAGAAAARARIASESEKATARDRRVARTEEAEALKVLKLAEAEAERARIDAENARSDAIVAMEIEKARLEALPKIIAEMVKPAEKIRGISINTISGLDRRGSDASPMNATLDAIMDMAVQLPALKKIGDTVGVNLQESVETALSTDTRKKPEEDRKDA